MNISIVTSIFAILISLASLAVTIYYKRKEEAKLKAFSTFFSGNEEDEPSLSVVAINIGRRPMIVRMLVGVDDDQEWSGVFLGEKNQGARLDEHERFEKKLGRWDLGFSWEDVEIDFSEFFFEDSLGRRWRVENSRKHIRDYREAYGKYWNAKEREREMYDRVVDKVKSTLQVQSSAEGRNSAL